MQLIRVIQEGVHEGALELNLHGVMFARRLLSDVNDAAEAADAELAYVFEVALVNPVITVFEG